MSFLSALCPVSLKFSKLAFVIKCLRNYKCFFLILSVFLFWIFLKPPRFSVHVVRSILLYNHILVASSPFFIGDEMVQDWQLYKKNDITYLGVLFFFLTKFCLYHNALLSFWKTCFSIPIRIWIFGFTAEDVYIGQLRWQIIQSYVKCNRCSKWGTWGDY